MVVGTGTMRVTCAVPLLSMKLVSVWGASLAVVAGALCCARPEGTAVIPMQATARTKAGVDLVNNLIFQSGASGIFSRRPC